MKQLLVGLGLALTFAAGACSSDNTPAPADAVVIDSPPPDASPPDADPMVECMTYCDCMDMNCPGSFTDHQACLDACALLDGVARECRIYHCSMATGGFAATHCPHARGESMCM